MSGLVNVAAYRLADVPAEPPCNLCGQLSKRLFQAHGFWFRRCLNCSHRFVELEDGRQHVEKVYSDNYFKSGGGGYHDYLSEQQLLLGRGHYYAKLLSRYMSSGTVLDVGTAAGFFLKALAIDGWTAHGIEPNASMALYAQAQLGLSVVHGSFEDYHDERVFDLVTMLQVIPHFARPRQAVDKAATVIKSRGYLLIETWDRSSLIARAFGKRWHAYNPPSVLHTFSREGLIGMVCSSGFELTAQARPQRWITAGYAKSMTRHRAQTSLAYRVLSALTSLLPSQMAIPYPGDDLFWALFRRSG